MYRVILCIAAALFITIAVRPAAANNWTVCIDGAGDEKIAACTRELRRDPRDPSNYRKRGDAYYSKGDYDRAISDFGEAIRLDPKSAVKGFEDFKKTVAKDDMVVLFYAGHGMGLNDGTYLVPADVRESSLQVDATARRVAISENELTEGLRQADAGVVVAVIDACRNDLFSRAVRRAAIGSAERGLRPAETEGVFNLYSASEGQTALDRLPGGDASRNSVFTRVFLKALDTPGLNLNALGARVRDEVYRLARSADHAQTPAVYDKLIGSTEVYFAGETTAGR
jgi:tetratricopeptide (TPR) repeat protein